MRNEYLIIYYKIYNNVLIKLCIIWTNMRERREWEGAILHYICQMHIQCL